MAFESRVIRVFFVTLALANALLLFPSGAAPAATAYVALNGNDAWSGRLPTPNKAHTDGPFATPQRARDALRGTSGPKKIYVRGGTYYLHGTIWLRPQDSGLAFLAYPGERPIFSGGRPITGWRRSSGHLWTATVPAARDRHWIIRQVRVGDQEQTLARTPNADPNDPKTGWRFVQPNGLLLGKHDAGLVHIDKPGDWLEWTMQAPAAGKYYVWFRYAAGLRNPRFPDPSGCSTIQTRVGRSQVVENLPMTGAWNVYQWSQVAEIDLAAGKNTLHWENAKGGDFNLAALAFSDDPAWNPAGGRIAAGRHAVTVQAMTFTESHVPGLSLPKYQAYRTKFHFRPGDVSSYRLSPDPEIRIIPGFGWFNEILHVKSIDQTAHVVTVEDNCNALEPILAGNRYYISNIREGLDSPGEWYLDRQTGVLTLWPKTADFRRQAVVAPKLDRIFDVRGDPAKNAWIESITIKGFQFSDTTYSRDINPYGAADAVIWMSGARDCVVQANRFINTNYALRLQDRSRRNAFTDNEIANSSEGGVILEGEAADQPVDNEISGNWMHQLGLVYKSALGVYCLTASRTRIAHNLIEDTPTYAIALKSFSSESFSHHDVVEYNILRRTGHEMSDTGAVNMFGGDEVDSGNIVQYNRIEDVIGMTTTSSGKILSPNYAWGIYLDGHESGVLVRGNLVLRAPAGGAFIHGGKDDTFTNNIFVGPKTPMTYDSSHRVFNNNVFCHNIIVSWKPSPVFNDIDVHFPPNHLISNDNDLWSTDRSRPFDHPGITPLGTLARWRAAGYDRASIVADPLFVNAASGDYRLRPGSPARKIGIQDLPFAQMGLPGKQIALHLGR